jgi:two-component system, OmpR family, response regulator
MNVLVIEDDRKIARLLERGLSEHGHLVTVSGNGREAAQMIIGGEYDAALLDILLPGIDGLAVLDRVRANAVRQRL